MKLGFDYYCSILVRFLAVTWILPAFILLNLSPSKDELSQRIGNSALIGIWLIGVGIFVFTSPPIRPKKEVMVVPERKRIHYESAEHARNLLGLEYDNLVHQTAALRLSPRWEDVRRLLAGKGYSPQGTLLCACDHAGGNDMAITIVLPNGQFVACQVRSFPPVNEYSAITVWDVQPDCPDEPLDLTAAITGNAKVAEAFHRATLAYRDFFEAYYAAYAAEHQKV